MVESRKKLASEINALLLRYYTEVQEIFKKFEVEEIMLTPSVMHLHWGFLLK